MKTLAILGLLGLLGSCASTTCAEDLTRPLSSCPVRAGPVITSEWVKITCGPARSVVIRTSELGAKDYCWCLEPKNKRKPVCR